MNCFDCISNNVKPGKKVHLSKFLNLRATPCLCWQPATIRLV
jgi:hypothetical protein